jgi:hypothetical protein
MVAFYRGVVGSRGGGQAVRAAMRRPGWQRSGRGGWHAVCAVGAKQGRGGSLMGGPEATVTGRRRLTSIQIQIQFKPFQTLADP